MTHVITETCIGVRGEACMEVCPESAIYAESEDRMSFIDPARCTDCGACVAACVVEAIYPEDDLPRASMEFTEINAQWVRRRSGVRARVDDIARELGLP